jgi:hypothetical protein
MWIGLGSFGYMQSMEAMVNDVEDRCLRCVLLIEQLMIMQYI